MIEEVLNSIISAEQQAEQIKTDAELKASEIIAKATEEADGIISKAEQDARAYRVSVVLEAEKTAEDNYNKTIEQTKNDATEQRKALDDKIQKLADEVYGGILNGDC